ncbi:DUF2147 domain-containing protein [Cryomorphaceae bacterium 1068]|nr:DUF2147 domain-containing protein [Cryomorphaceae bacterium 1068]
MKSLLSLVFAFAFSTLFAQSADDVLGLWLVQDKDAYVRIFKKDGKYFGRVTWLEEPYDENGKPITDPNGEPILEMEVVSGFVFEEDEWVDGTVYDAEIGKTYHGSMEMEDHDTLNLRGSLDSFGLLGRTETWTRLKERGNK